ncbi:MAG: histidine kinase dimerization/phospho-acceptor domain-containing protein, partial [Phycisphaerae bacterium]
MAHSSSADPVAPHEPGVSKLAAKVAHELNNPLDAVLRYVSLAQRKAKSGQFSDIERYLADAQFGLQRMAETLRELMDLGRQTNDILSGGSRQNTVPLADLIAGAIRTAAAHAEQKHVALIIKNLLPPPPAPTHRHPQPHGLPHRHPNPNEDKPRTTTEKQTNHTNTPHP